MRGVRFRSPARGGEREGAERARAGRGERERKGREAWRKRKGEEDEEEEDEEEEEGRRKEEGAGPSAIQNEHPTQRSVGKNLQKVLKHVCFDFKKHGS